MLMLVVFAFAGLCALAVAMPYCLGGDRLGAAGACRAVGTWGALVIWGNNTACAAPKMLREAPPPPPP
jgi:hypothetical protein